MIIYYHYNSVLNDNILFYDNIMIIYYFNI